MKTLNPQEIYTQLMHLVNCEGITPMVHGSPGISKSAITQRVARDINHELIDWRGSSADPTDTNGLPMRNLESGKAEYMPFDTFPLEGDELPKGKDGWVIAMEEINSAPRAVIAACYKLILDRLVGNRKLHPAVKIICLGNLSTDGAIVQPIGTAMQSRLVHLIMGVDVKETIQFMAKSGFDKRIIAYANWKPGNVYNFVPKNIEYTFPCIRTWSFVNSIITGQLELAPLAPSIHGAISLGVGREFIAFCAIFHTLPDLNEVVKNPATAPIPNEADVRFALATAIAEHMTDDNLADWVIYVDRFPMELKLLVINTLFGINPSLAMDDRTDPLIQQVKSYII